MSELLHVSSSPHIRSGMKTQTIMFMVLIALLPASVMGIYLFGIPALTVILISVGTSVLTVFSWHFAFRLRFPGGSLSLGMYLQS